LANQTTAAAIVAVANSKAIKAIIGSSTIALLRGRFTDTKCSPQARRAIGGWMKENQKKMVAHPVSLEPVSVGAIPC
jgi:hypothetical protein